MSFFENAVALDLEVFDVEFQKRDTVFVPARNFHSLTFRRCGKINISSNEKKYISDANTVTFVPKNKEYYTKIIESGDIIAIHFDMTKEADDLDDIKVFSELNSEIMQNLFNALLKKYTVENRRDYGCLSLFYQILSLLEANEKEKNSVTFSKRAENVKKYIENNYYNPELSVSELSKQFGVSEVYLRKEFKLSFGVSPLSYINGVRIENAKAMLKTRYYSVADVAKKCGYLSASYFSAAFRKIVGMSPGDYMG